MSPSNVSRPPSRILGGGLAVYHLRGNGLDAIRRLSSQGKVKEVLPQQFHKSDTAVVTTFANEAIEVEEMSDCPAQVPHVSWIAFLKLILRLERSSIPFESLDMIEDLIDTVPIT